MSSVAVAPAPGAVYDDEGGRGRTIISDRVVQRIATRAVGEVDRATGAVRRVLGVPMGSTDETTPARVEAQVDGGIVTLSIDLAVVWPNSVRAVTREVRQHVTSRLQELTGLRVADVDIDVSELLTETAPPPRVQ